MPCWSTVCLERGLERRVYPRVTLLLLEGLPEHQLAHEGFVRFVPSDFLGMGAHRLAPAQLLDELVVPLVPDAVADDARRGGRGEVLEALGEQPELVGRSEDSGSEVGTHAP